MHRLLLTLAILIAPLFLAPSAKAQEGPSQAELEKLAKSYVALMANEAIIVLTTSETRAEREIGFRKLLADHANMRRIARYTLGQYARQVTNEEFEEYVALLNELIIKVYANRLGDYSNEQIEIGNVKSKQRNFIVSSQIVFDNDREAIPIDWWLRKEKSGGFSLFDVRVLGVWMAQEQRDSFVSVLKQNKGNVTALLDHIRKSVERGSAATDKASEG